MCPATGGCSPARLIPIRTLYRPTTSRTCRALLTGTDSGFKRTFRAYPYVRHGFCTDGLPLGSLALRGWRGPRTYLVVALWVIRVE